MINMNILSLFDGLSGGRIALERANIKVDNYYASEIDKFAIQVSMLSNCKSASLSLSERSSIRWI